MLWGKFAQEKRLLIDETKHLILKAAHPSPLSAHAGFFGCKHFSQANEYLMSKGIDPINWQL
jgi:uracil-DNA glycosylase